MGVQADGRRVLFSSLGVCTRLRSGARDADGNMSIDRIPHELENGLIEMMLDLLEEFSNRPVS